MAPAIEVFDPLPTMHKTTAASEVYVGELESTAPVSVPDGTAELPRRISSYFPEPIPAEPIRQSVRRGDLNGEQINDTAAVARVSQAQLLELIHRHYDGPLHRWQAEAADSHCSAYVRRQLESRLRVVEQLVRFAESLEADREYALVVVDLQ
jgi:hypothetical protein